MGSDFTMLPPHMRQHLPLTGLGPPYMRSMGTTRFPSSGHRQEVTFVGGFFRFWSVRDADYKTILLYHGFD